MRTLVTGGVRSGKSRFAEELLSGEQSVTYIAPGGPADESDPEWAARIAAHRTRRPAHWTTLETTDVATALTSLRGPALVDCLGTWLTAQLDQLEGWDRPGWEDELDGRIEALAGAWSDCSHTVVAVTNEVGWGLVSEHRSGRIFTDWLGRTNQAVGAASDEVWLVIAGRRLRLP